MSKKLIKKDNNKPILSSKIICILYSVCAICWLFSGYFDLKKDSKSLLGYIDIGLGAVWIMLAIVYYRKYKNEK